MRSGCRRRSALRHHVSNTGRTSASCSSLPCLPVHSLGSVDALYLEASFTARVSQARSQWSQFASCRLVIRKYPVESGVLLSIPTGRAALPPSPSMHARGMHGRPFPPCSAVSSLLVSTRGRTARPPSRPTQKGRARRTAATSRRAIALRRPKHTASACRTGIPQSRYPVKETRP